MGQIISFFVNLFFPARYEDLREEHDVDDAVIEPTREVVVDTKEKENVVADESIPSELSFEANISDPAHNDNEHDSSAPIMDETLDLLTSANQSRIQTVIDSIREESKSTGLTNTEEYLYSRGTEEGSTLDYDLERIDCLATKSRDDSYDSANDMAEVSEFMMNEQPTLELLHPNSEEIDVELLPEDVEEMLCKPRRTVIDETMVPPNSCSETSRDLLSADMVINYMKDDEVFPDENKENESPSMEHHKRDSVHIADTAIREALREVFQDEPGITRDFVEQLGTNISTIRAHARDGSVSSLDVNTDSHDYLQVNLEHELKEAATSKLAAEPSKNDSGCSGTAPSEEVDVLQEIVV